MIVNVTPSAARTASPCTSGCSTSVGASPAAIASSPSVRAATLLTIAGTTAREPERRMPSTAPKMRPMAIIGPQPMAYITAVIPKVCSAIRAHSRQPS